MATPEQPVATPPASRKPSSAATLGAAASGSLAAGRVAVVPTLVATGVATRAVADATSQIVEALRAFARVRQATIIPLLQRQLTETFVNRTPDEIARLLGKETMRERQFLKRQASRMARDLPGVLAEADVDVRRAKMAKLLAREQRYMAQREAAMTARAHSVVESLDLQEASPEGAFWQLGGAIHHTAGCIAMAGKFWPWQVLREVAIPPVHPGCACTLMSLDEAVKAGHMLPHQLPDVKDALARARRFMALEEAFEDAESDEDVRAAMVADVIGEAQRRYAKGLAHGGEFQPKLGGDFSDAKGALRKLLPHGAAPRDAGRHLWIKGHHTFVPHDRLFSRKIGGVMFHSPAGSTNVYRTAKGQDIVSVEGEASPHPDFDTPKGEAAGRVAPAAGAVPAEILDAEAGNLAAMKRHVEMQNQHGARPIDVGHDAKAAHDALQATGFTVVKSKGTKGTLDVAYKGRTGDLDATYGRASGKVEGIRWKPGKRPKAKKLSGDFDAWLGSGSGGPKPSSFAKPLKPIVPVPPTEHPARTTGMEPPGLIPNYDHVALTVPAHRDVATGPDGERYVLRQGQQDHVASELLANAVYRALGVSVPAAGVRHIDEPDFAAIPDVDLGEGPIDAGLKRTSSGIILRHPNGDVTIFEPKNHFGGYEHSFPKGGVEAGLSPQQNAHKELWEETGLHAKITGVVGDYAGDTSVSRYYTGVMTGGTPTAGPETEAVKTVPADEAEKLLNKPRDKEILADVLKHPLPSGDAPADEFPETVGMPAVLSPSVPGSSRTLTKPSEALGAHFMADALLANWNVLGKGDQNVRWNGEEPTRLGQSGALGFRSNGDAKPFGHVPHEVWSMLGPKGEAFGKAAVTEQQRRDQAAAIEKALPPARVDALVDAAPFADDTTREGVRAALNGRVAWMGRYSRGEENEPEPLQGPAAAAELVSSQEGLALFPEQHAAVALYPAEMDAIDAHIVSGAKTDAATEDQRLIVKELDSILRHVETEEDVIAYSGVDPVAVLGGAESIVGKTLSNKGFLNMTLAEGEARKEAGVVQITIPAGSHALYTRGIPGVDDVDERTPDVLAPRKSRLRIVGQYEKAGKTYFEAVLLP